MLECTTVHMRGIKPGPGKLALLEDARIELGTGQIGTTQIGLQENGTREVHAPKVERLKLLPSDRFSAMDHRLHTGRGHSTFSFLRKGTVLTCST